MTRGGPPAPLPPAVARLLALALAILLPCLPLARAAGIAEKPECAMHRVTAKRLPCHDMGASKHDCCKRETSFARDLCSCGHSDEASGVSREPSLAPARARYSIAVAGSPLKIAPVRMSTRVAEPPDTPPPICRS